MRDLLHKRVQRRPCIPNLTRRERFFLSGAPEIVQDHQASEGTVFIQLTRRVLGLGFTRNALAMRTCRRDEFDIDQIQISA